MDDSHPGAGHTDQGQQENGGRHSEANQTLSAGAADASWIRRCIGTGPDPGSHRRDGEEDGGRFAAAAAAREEAREAVGMKPLALNTMETEMTQRAHWEILKWKGLGELMEVWEKEIREVRRLWTGWRSSLLPSLLATHVRSQQLKPPGARRRRRWGVLRHGCTPHGHEGG